MTTPECSHLISAGNHLASIARRCADAAYGRGPAPTPDTVNAVITAWRNAAADAVPQRPRDFLAGFAAGMMACHGTYCCDGPGWSNASELLMDMEDLATPLMDLWLIEGSNDFEPLIEAAHQRSVRERPT